MRIVGQGTRWLNVIKVVAGAVILLLVPTGSLAQTCSVTALTMNFGSYDPHNSASTLTTGTISFRCTASVPIKIKIYGTNEAGPSGMRLTSRNYALQYKLFLDPARTVLWGDGLNGTEYYTEIAPPANTNVTVPVFGEILPEQQKASIGAYVDMRTIEIDY